MNACCTTCITSKCLTAILSTEKQGSSEIRVATCICLCCPAPLHATFCLVCVSQIYKRSPSHQDKLSACSPQPSIQINPYYFGISPPFCLSQPTNDSNIYQPLLQSRQPPHTWSSAKMKLNNRILTGLFVTINLTTTHACVHAWGRLINFEPGPTGVYVIDNGILVCSSLWGWVIDGSDNISLSCYPGYIYATSRHGNTAWYRTGPNTAYSWDQNAVDYVRKVVISEWDVLEFC